MLSFPIIRLDAELQIFGVHTCGDVAVAQQQVELEHLVLPELLLQVRWHGIRQGSVGINRQVADQPRSVPVKSGIEGECPVGFMSKAFRT